MTDNVVDISKYIANKCYEEKNPTSNLKLQMMLYFISDDYLKETGKHLFTNDFNAYGFGPAVPESYYHFAGFGVMPITLKYDININNTDKAILDKLIDRYSKEDCSKLTAKARAKDMPWRQVYDVIMGNRTEVVVPLPTEFEQDKKLKSLIKETVDSYEMPKAEADRVLANILEKLNINKPDKSHKISKDNEIER